MTNFQYTATVTLNYEEMKWNIERVSNYKTVYKQMQLGRNKLSIKKR